MALIGSYETHEQIGEDSYGLLYKASDVLLERTVALRILNRSTELDPKVQENLARYGWVGPGLSQQNIELFYDFGEDRGNRYLVTEFLTGTSLQSYFGERSGLSLLKKLNMTIQICDAVAHAHRHEILHLHLNPMCLFVHKRQSAKVSGFGLRRGLPVGTGQDVDPVPNQEYSAPEQILGDPGDERSDLFSLATIFCEFLVSGHPFESEDTVQQIVKRQPRSLCERDPLVPVSVERTLFKALKKDPGARTQTAEAFALELRATERQLRLSYLSTRGVVDLPCEATLRFGGDGLRQTLQVPRSASVSKWHTVSKAGKKPWVAYFSKATPFQTQVAGTALIASLILVSALIVGQMRTGRTEKAIAQSQVQVRGASLLEGPSQRSRTLISLKSGARVNVLERPGVHQPFVRVQVTTENRGPLAGYIAIHDLGQWRSESPEVEWEFLSMSQPDASSADFEVHRYLTGLERFRDRFPGSSQASVANAETQRWTLQLERKALLQNQTWAKNLAANSEKAAALDASGEPEPVPENSREVESILKAIPGLWEDGDLERVVTLSQKVLAIDPGNDRAKAWRSKARRAIQKLSSPQESH